MLSRIISALCALAILLGTLYFAGSTGLTILGSIIVFIAAVEYATLFERSLLWLAPFLALDTIVYTVHILKPELTLAALVASFIALISLGILLFHKQEPKEIMSKLQWTLWGILYTGLLPALSVRLLYVYGWKIMMFLLITVFFGDIFAFFSGLYFGGKKIFPTISPKKTVSGAIGGLFGSVFCGIIFLQITTPLTNWFLAFFFCLCIGIFAQLGDFFESLIKRIAGKKDASQLMPGHGGFLDRLDGVYFGSVVVYLFWTVFDFTQYF